MAGMWHEWRLLVADGQRFRWQCSFNHPLEMLSVGFAERGHLWSPDLLLVRPEDRSSRRLTVSWPPCKGPVVKPGLVRACIDEARRRGWLGESPIMEIEGLEVPFPVPRLS